MKLDRNLDGNDGLGKYALLLLRKLADHRSGTFQRLAPEIANAITILENAGIVDWGVVNTPSEFFVIRLKDRYAQAALLAYAAAARVDDPEYADEIDSMALRSGPFHPNCKIPD